MRFGIDLDGVCYQWDKTARYMLREVLPDSQYKSPVGPLSQESQDWDYIERHVSKEDWQWLWTEGVRLGLFRHGHLYPGTIKYLHALASLGELIVITHRPKSAVEDTLAWLVYQQLPLSGIHILTNQEPKTSVKCDVYIDDKLENVIALATTGARVYLMDRPWNYGLTPAGVVRVFGWKNFYDEVR